MKKHLIGIGFSLVMVIPTPSISDDKTDFCDYVSIVVGATALKRNMNISLEDSKKALIKNLQEYVPNISIYRLAYLMNLIELIYKESRDVSEKNLPKLQDMGVMFQLMTKLLTLKKVNKAYSAG